MSGNNIAGALAAAQKNFPAIPKNKTGKVKGEGRSGPYEYEYKYADIGDVLSAVRPVLSDAGIAVVQATEETDHGCVLVTRLLYGSECIEGRMPLPIEKASPQQVGSLLTYYRRYALCALVGVAAEEDDDGQGASAVTHSKKRGQRRNEPRASAEDVKVITDLFDGMPDEERKAKKDAFKERFGIPAELTRDQVPEALAYLGLDAPFMKESE